MDSTDPLPKPSAMTESNPAYLRYLTEGLEAAVSGGDLPLPPYPVIAQRVQQALARPEVGLAEVSRLVAADASLAADVLRCANSATYWRGDPVTGLSQAASRIGASQLFRLLLAASLGVVANRSGPLAELRRIVWIESLASAALCQELSAKRGLKGEDAFTLGLLHDFGKIVATSCLESLVARRPGRERPLEVWTDLVERHHVALGVALATRWELPEIIRDAVAAHHAAPGPHDSRVLDVVRTCDRVVALLMKTPGVSSDQLAGLPELPRFAEREALARAARKLPELVESLSSQGGSPPLGATLVARPPSTLESGARAVRFPVKVKLGRQEREYSASAITRNALALSGSQPLDEQRLFQTTLLSTPGPLHIWALARLSRPEKGSFRIEIHPFGLSGVERAMWDDLAAGAPAAG